MEPTSGHQFQWIRNRTLIPQIPLDYPDWIVTVTFYTALHAVDALLIDHWKHSRVTDHKSRNAVLTETNSLLAISKAYLPLYNLSRTVRYLADPRRWIPLAQLESQVFPYLYKIETSVQKLTGKDHRLSRIVLGIAPPKAS